MTLFFDRNFGHDIPQALRILGLDVTWHDEHFAPTTRDEEWLAEAGQRDWVVITHDARIAVNESERRALANAGVRCFVLRGGNADRWGKTRELAFAWQKIAAILNTETPPFIWHRRPSGGWVRLYP